MLGNVWEFFYKLIWGRCYDHNFLRFLPIFGEKNGVFLKNQCYDNIFAKNSSSLSKKRRFFRRKIRRKYLKNRNIGPWSHWNKCLPFISMCVGTFALPTHACVLLDQFKRHERSAGIIQRRKWKFGATSKRRLSIRRLLELRYNFERQNHRNVELGILPNLFNLPNLT
jgi:hypothetical protein